MGGTATVPQIDLSAGLVPALPTPGVKKAGGDSGIDLSAGMVPAASAGQSDSTTSAPDSLTTNAKHEGTYSMQSPNDSAPVKIPYSNVLAASNSGYKITPVDRERYAGDRIEEIRKQAKASGRQPTMDDLHAMKLPEAAPESLSLWSKLRSGVLAATEPTDVFHGVAPTGQPATDLATDEAMANVLKRAGRFLFGTVDMPVQAVGILHDLASNDPKVSEDAETRLQDLHPGAQISLRGREFIKDWKQDPKLAVENVTGDAAGMWAVGKVGEAGKLGLQKTAAAALKATEPILPKSVQIAGVDIPVLASEAAPSTRGAGMVESVKGEGGVGAKEFTKFTNRQQAAVRQVIRNVAQDTAQPVGPIPNEPAAAVDFAADATFAHARPMYQALDAAGVTVPDEFARAGEIVNQAIAKARKLGVEFDDSKIGGQEYVDKDGNPVSRQDVSPAKFDRMVANGELTLRDIKGTQPLTTYMTVRSQLLKMARASSDPAVRQQIYETASDMTSNIENELADTPLEDNFREANRLWSKGYALRDVAEALHRTTKGTPENYQAAGIEPQPVEIGGSGLVSRLNDLDREGVLQKAFTPEEIKNLRASADILDRIDNSVGTQRLLKGYSARTTWLHLLKSIGEAPFAYIMTNGKLAEGLRTLADPASYSKGLSAAQRLRQLALRMTAASAVEPEQRQAAADRQQASQQADQQARDAAAAAAKQVSEDKEMGIQ